MKTFVYKLNPTKAQAALLAETLETCRRLYNDALAERRDAWKQRGESIGFYQQSDGLPARRALSPWLSRVSIHVLRDVLKRLDHAFRMFFCRVKTGRAPGYPRFKGKGRYDSFTFTQHKVSWSIENGRLALGKLGKIGKVGAIRIRLHRPLEGTPKTCTIVRKADGWHAHIVCDVPATPLPATGRTVGIDLGIESFATLSDGQSIPNPRYYRAALRKLKQAHRRLSRRVKGSKRRAKARTLLAKAHQKVARQRRDHAHKVARVLVDNYDTIAIEKLNIRGMVRNHLLAQAISDAGWGGFCLVLHAKAASAGRVVLEVNPAGTSQMCAQCGEHVPKRLSVRWHSCPYCGHEAHRDHNAAQNILQRAQSVT